MKIVCNINNIRDYNFIGKRKFERTITRFIQEEVTKSERGMPRLPEATKDVASCEKARGTASRY